MKLFLEVLNNCSGWKMKGGGSVIQGVGSLYGVCLEDLKLVLFFSPI